MRRILEDLFVSFADATAEEVQALPDQQAIAQTQALLDDIARRRAQGEG